MSDINEVSQDACNEYYVVPKQNSKSESEPDQNLLQILVGIP